MDRNKDRSQDSADQLALRVKGVLQEGKFEPKERPWLQDRTGPISNGRQLNQKDQQKALDYLAKRSLKP